MLPAVLPRDPPQTVGGKEGQVERGDSSHRGSPLSIRWARRRVDEPGQGASGGGRHREPVARQMAGNQSASASVPPTAGSEDHPPAGASVSASMPAFRPVQRRVVAGGWQPSAPASLRRPPRQGRHGAIPPPSRRAHPHRCRIRHRAAAPDTGLPGQVPGQRDRAGPAPRAPSRCLPLVARRGLLETGWRRLHRPGRNASRHIREARQEQGRCPRVADQLQQGRKADGLVRSALLPPRSRARQRARR